MSGVLGSEQIRKRRGEIFASNWSEDCVQEASYDLRVADDVLMVERKLYRHGDPYKNLCFNINPGDLALLSSVETFHMPRNVAGRLGIKFKYTRKGLTPLFGAQVDPYYGHGIKYPDQTGERIYLWVSNLGPSPILIETGEKVFTIEFHTIDGKAENLQGDRKPIRDEIEKQAYNMQTSARIGFMDVVRDEVIQETKDDISRLNVRVDAIEGGTQQIVLFGVFLVASAILATSIAAMFAMIFAIDLGGESYIARSLTTNAVRTLLFFVAVVLTVALLSLVGAAVIWAVKGVLSARTTVSDPRKSLKG